MVRLVPMTPGEFGPYLERLIQLYAREHIRTGRWTEENGPAEARKEVEHLLPAGLQSLNQFVFAIRLDSSDEPVGSLWLAIQPQGAFVYDLEILEPFRRKGYAESAMRLVEEIARGKGAQRISLHVFGDNRGARSLYAKLGYTETNVAMSKTLSG